MEHITIEELKEMMSTGMESFDTNQTYIVDLENCNGISSSVLDKLKELQVDIKFYLDGDLYGCKSYEDIGKRKYNYSIDQMQKIITIVEECGKDMPESLTESGRFVYLYKVLADTIIYKDTTDIFDHLNLEGRSEDRSIYTCLVNGEGVCAGYSLTLKNVLNYYGINCICLDGMAMNSIGESGSHAWNAVKVDGKYYFVDLTFDSSTDGYFENCLVTNEFFQESHELGEASRNKIEGLKFSEADFLDDPEDWHWILDQFNKDSNIQETIQKIKSYQINRGRKSFSESAKELTGSELIRGLFDDKWDDISEGMKSIGDDFEDMIQSDSMVRAEGVQSITTEIKNDINSNEKESDKQKQQNHTDIE